MPCWARDQNSARKSAEVSENKRVERKDTLAPFIMRNPGAMRDINQFSDYGTMIRFNCPSSNSTPNPGRSLTIAYPAW